MIARVWSGYYYDPVEQGAAVLELPGDLLMMCIKQPQYLHFRLPRINLLSHIMRFMCPALLGGRETVATNCWPTSVCSGVFHHRIAVNLSSLAAWPPLFKSR